jgi:hypothetical protein
MGTTYPGTKNDTVTFFNNISFVKKFPIDTPVYVTCSYPNHGDVRMLVIPHYYHNEAFRCEILAVDLPLLPPGYVSCLEDRGEININVCLITSWKLWSPEDGFLNFGNGYITETYLNMVLN